MKPSDLKPATPCLCGSGKAIKDCCAPYLSGDARPDTAEALMRSRYTAYTLAHKGYLLATWHPKTRPTQFTLDPAQKFVGLKILSRSAGQPEDDEGFVSFVARYKINGKGYKLEEHSRFVRIDGEWLYDKAIES